jgi:6,7-dimethyl-8-ribityllumazine synthase
MRLADRSGADPGADTVRVHEGRLEGDGVRVAIACSRFNGLVTERLLAGALGALSRCGVSPAGVEVAWAPGSFELPLVASRLARSGRFDAVVCLGAVIRGETDHYQHVATQCVAGIQRVQLDSQVPVLLGVLTTDSTEQALERAGAKQGNKGAEVALAALEMVSLLRDLPPPPPAPSDTGPASSAGSRGEPSPFDRPTPLTTR